MNLGYHSKQFVKDRRSKVHGCPGIYLVISAARATDLHRQFFHIGYAKDAGSTGVPSSLRFEVWANTCPFAFLWADTPNFKIINLQPNYIFGLLFVKRINKVLDDLLSCFYFFVCLFFNVRKLHCCVLFK